MRQPSEPLPEDLSALPFVAFIDKRQLPRGGGVYFVLKGDEVLYIGESATMRERWYSHSFCKYIREQGIEDQVKIAWVEMPYPYHQAYQDACIMKWMPKFGRDGRVLNKLKRMARESRLD